MTLTTGNHSGIAITALIITQDSPIEVKTAVCGGLFLSHFVLGVIPHWHWHWHKLVKTTSDQKKKDRFDVLVEVGSGMLVIPIVMALLLHLDFFWIFAYTIMASGWDIIVFFKVRYSKAINHRLHFWMKDFEIADMIVIEIFQTCFIFALLFLAWGGSM